jgi:hypothetical protein
VKPHGWSIPPQKLSVVVPHTVELQVVGVVDQIIAVGVFLELSEKLVTFGL